MSTFSQLERPRQAFIVGWPFNNLGGVSAVVRNLVREFARNGDLAPLVIEACPDAQEQSGAAEIPLIRQTLPSPYNETRPIKALAGFCVKMPGLLWRWRRMCLEHQIAVLNPHFIGLEFFGLMLLRRLGLFKGQLFLSFHGSDIRGMLQSRGVERYFSKLLLRGADRLIACSNALAEEIEMFVPDCKPRIVAIPNGIDAQHFLDNAEPDFVLPERFAERRKIVSVGAFEHKKGHDVLLRAFAEVKRTQPEACLILAGQTAGKLSETQQLVIELGLADDVLLLRDTPHSRIAAILQLCDLFVLSSRWEKGICGEGFAMALLEAAAAAMPVVSTASCGVAELIRDGVSGWVVPTEQPSLLAQAIEQALANPEISRCYGRTLYASVCQEFTWVGAHAKYLALADRSLPVAAATLPPVVAVR